MTEMRGLLLVEAPFSTEGELVKHNLRNVKTFLFSQMFLDEHFITNCIVIALLIVLVAVLSMSQ